MKIAIIINTSWNIYNFRKGLIDHFMSKGHQVVAIAPQDDYSQKLVELGCSYYALDFPGTSTNPIKDLSLVWRLYRILKTANPDIILTYTIKPNIYTSLVSGVLRIPCICNVSGLGTVFLWKGSLKRIAVSLYKVAFRFSSWIFFQNEEDRKDFMEVVPINPKKTSVLPGSGVNLAHFQLDPYKKRDVTTFLMVARLIVEKGVVEFSEAAKQMSLKHSNVRFRIVGGYESGHARSVDQSLLDEWKASTYIEWIAHQEDIRPYLEEADVVVLPSYREGTPKTLLEAGAMGKALIASDAPGCRQVVKNGVNGFLCKVKDSKDLANKMKLYLSLNQEEKLQMHLNSRKHIEENYDEKIVIDLYERKIKELSGKK
ncbi:MAG: glycosyltransferase family 4 protein [Cyclobacteriaceae bacterium]|nr:glycosyltransferase family 4 protein [Cyclobacteriaceae bacterium SS2]